MRRYSQWLVNSPCPRDVRRYLEQDRLPQMNNVTDVFQSYREHARHLRNTAFSTLQNRSWDISSDFDDVNAMLFDRLVLTRIPSLPYATALKWEDNDAFLIEASGGGFRGMISRNKGATGYWDHAIEMLMKGDAKIAFQRFFDWDELGLIDYRYVYGIIRESVRYPKLVDHHVLILTDQVEIIVNSQLLSMEILDNKMLDRSGGPSDS